MSNPFEDINNRLIKIEETLERLSSLKTHQPEIKYYSISEAAKLLKVANITLYRKIQSGEIPFKRIGSRLMIPASFFNSASQAFN